MIDENDDKNIEQTIESAAKKLNIEIDALRRITPQEVEFLLDHCPFLQLLGPEIITDRPPFKIIQSRAGWDIHDYGDALSTSPGRFLFGGGYFSADEDDESGGGVIVNAGHGTIVNQAWLAAVDMVQLAEERNWRFLTIVDGHRIMKRAVWIHASELGITVEGFEPDLEDDRIRQLVTESSEDFQRRIAQIRKAPPTLG